MAESLEFVLKECLLKLCKMEVFQSSWECLQSEWILTTDDLFAALNDDRAWSNLRLPTRLKIELKSRLTEKKESNKNCISAKTPEKISILGVTLSLPSDEGVYAELEKPESALEEDAWTKLYSAEYDCYYYYNNLTQESQWEVPENFVDCNDESEAIENRDGVSALRQVTEGESAASTPSAPDFPTDLLSPLRRQELRQKEQSSTYFSSLLESRNDGAQFTKSGNSSTSQDSKSVERVSMDPLKVIFQPRNGEQQQPLPPVPPSPFALDSRVPDAGYKSPPIAGGYKSPAADYSTESAAVTVKYPPIPDLYACANSKSGAILNEPNYSCSSSSSAVSSNCVDIKGPEPIFSPPSYPCFGEPSNAIEHKGSITVNEVPAHETPKVKEKSKSAVSRIRSAFNPQRLRSKALSLFSSSSTKTKKTPSGARVQSERAKGEQSEDAQSSESDEDEDSNGDDVVDVVVNDEFVERLREMGFSKMAATLALEETNNSLSNAAFLLVRLQEDGEDVAEPPPTPIQKAVGYVSKSVREVAATSADFLSGDRRGDTNIGYVKRSPVHDSPRTARRAVSKDRPIPTTAQYTHRSPPLSPVTNNRRPQPVVAAYISQASCDAVPVTAERL